MKLFTLIAAPLLLMAQGYILVITHTNGTKTEIPTEEITDMVFQPEQAEPDPDQLPTFKVVSTKTSPNSYILAWNDVEGASYYGWTIDDDSRMFTTTNTQCNITDLTVGEHKINICAYPESNSGLKASEPVELTLSAELVLKTVVTSKDKTTATASISVNTTESCTVGIVPGSVMGTANQIEYINNNAAAQRNVFTGTPGSTRTVTFTDLIPGTEYAIVTFLTDNTAQAFTTTVITSSDLKPGDKGSIFPPGVSADNGWIDVDKVGDLSKYGWTGADNLMCWACTAAGMIQWWLNDYKAKTGHDFETAYPIPTVSQCYTTPVMDLMVDYWLHGAGDQFKAIKWFFGGVPYNEGNENGEKMLNESLPYWKGGFGGMTPDEAQKLMVVNDKSSAGYTVAQFDFNRRIDIQGKTQDETIKIFSDRIMDALRQGPVALSIVGNAGNNVHAISCWGADFEVLADGSCKVNELYIGENDPLAGNVRNGMNKGIITYDGDYVKFEMPTTSGKKNLNLFFGLRGYQGN